MRPLFALLVLAACSPKPDADTAAADVQVCPEVPPAQVSLPADDALHGEPIEWWYWTGHLEDASGRWYGFEQAAFVFQMEGYAATMIHSAVTDVEGGRFQYEVAYEHDLVPDKHDDTFSIQAEGATVEGGSGTDRLVGVIDDTHFDLSLTADTAAVLQHGDGYHEYDFGGYTWYYSRPRMSVSGTLHIDGADVPVTGTSWFDHQWGDLLAASTNGWDWFALHLDDGRDVMLFMVSGGTELVGGSIRDGDCVEEVDPADLVVTGTDPWVSPETGCSYPQSWQISIGDDLQLTVESVLPEQELVHTANTYWEGAARVSGDVSGRAYVELAGQCN